MGALAARYIHKPTEVLAVELTEDNLESVAGWVNGDIFQNPITSTMQSFFRIESRDSEFMAEVGDIVVLDNDEFFSMDKETFYEKYVTSESTNINGVWLTNPFSG
ncbi:hypothetical protein SEA_GOCRAZY_70 [Arthrobacter phage GoCrazy]|uniref:Uncharacterized protein n=5 Tax=Mudcatvirus TaxID=1982088 RepID=A0AAE8XJV5_9CAUD|nr:hypothetical protein FDH65_gp75 [Arthrobacter phage Circum]YP_010666651.1 hypothetical protein PQB80_gp072 [Arthrobacter phage JEGGS]YP_010666752.1 hypothetical protein PQB81_gp073 [Arthrobacter phage Kardesai]YP_010666852.1 hypothetical protein PQB82_gp73 [Arthrobacter phage Dynamite]YP_010666947.1 hypothetical protein PQB83_gp69 [Arthrobacter phage KeaneyLin]QFP95042.1 hypothetical protein SEA_NAPOLEONB_74 [Arthrobacter phage NapoleonB]QXO13568.1 hypothetical protein SEA_GOCRAZY_70 [Arth